MIYKTYTQTGENSSLESIDSNRQANISTQEPAHTDSKADSTFTHGNQTSYERVPQELKDLPQWVVWRKEEREGKPTKVPYIPGTKRRASTTNPDTWASFESAVASCALGNFDGIGFVFSKDDPYCGVDFDDVIEDGIVDERVQREVAALESYTEYSPTRNGLHVIVKTDLALRKHRTKTDEGIGFEAYADSRFFTVTGDTLENTTNISISHSDNSLRECVEGYLGREAIGDDGEEETAILPVVPNKDPQGANDLTSDDLAILHRARSASNGDKFKSLFDDGDLSSYDGDHSAADMALCGLLAYWTGNDQEQMDRMFRSSALTRPKWDEKRGTNTYGERTIAEATKDKVTKPVDQPTGGILNTTDCGNAERFANLHGQDTRYVHTWGKWLIWDGKRWKEDDTERVLQYAKSTARSILAEASACADDQQRSTLLKWAKQSESRDRIQAQLLLARSEPGIAVTHQRLDQEHFLFNCENGTIDLKTGKRKHPSRGDLITKMANVTHDPTAQCPRWLSFLDRIMDGDQELIGFLQRFAGYSMTGDVSEQCLVFMYGSGANGKSTFIEVLCALFGDYFQKAPNSLIMAKKDGSGGIPNDVARLPGARMVVAAEVEEGNRMAEGQIKDLTGGDRITARFLRQEFFEFDPTHKLWIYGNHQPWIHGDDWGIWRRIHQVPFTVTISDDEKDPFLKQRLIEEELPGILNWCVQGCLDWQNEGLCPPAKVQEATEAYRSDMDLLGEFLEECTNIDVGKTLLKKDLYKEYDLWCKANGHHPLSNNRLTRQLKQRGYKERKSGGQRVWEDLVLKSSCTLGWSFEF